MGLVSDTTSQRMAKRAGATVRDVAASHAVYVSQPGVVASLIEEAMAKSVDGAVRDL